MALKVLIIPDKFKGTLTAPQAAEAIAAGWRSQRGDDIVELLPMSDGGDGFGEILSSLLGAVPQKTKAVDAAHRPREAIWWWDAGTKTAIIESAQVIGLALLPPRKYHPFELDTEGLSLIFQEALANGAKRCLVGIGGSATNDGGFGFARELGWQFFGLHDEKIARWTELRDLAQIRRPELSPWFDEVTVAVDVQNPLLGPRGCTQVYGPQKGLRPQEFEFAETCLAQLAAVVEKQLHLSFAREAGAGAAGGLGYGLKCFANARLEPGFALFATYAKLPQRMEAVDLVITGEGAIDESTIMGKGVGEVAAVARSKGARCFGLAGSVTLHGPSTFDRLYAITPELANRDDATKRADYWLAELARKAAREMTNDG